MKLSHLLYILERHSRPRSQSLYIKRAYDSVATKLRVSNSDVITDVLINKLNITDHMKEKLISLIKTKLSKSDLKNINEIELRYELTNVIGIGVARVNALIKSGLNNIIQLKDDRFHKYLNAGTVSILKIPNIFKHNKINICRRIPYKTIKSLEKKITNYKYAEVMLVGSFIRKKPFSKDIDIMVVTDVSIDGYLSYLDTIFSNKLIVYMKGDHKVSLLLEMNDIFYKIDIFRTPIKNKYTMLLYSTGSKNFNIRMRAIAKKQNYILNQTGLYKLPSKTLIIVSSEQDIFNNLNIKYILPKYR